MTSFTVTEEDAWCTNQSNIKDNCFNFDQYDARLRLMAKIYMSNALQKLTDPDHQEHLQHRHVEAGAHHGQPHEDPCHLCQERRALLH